MRQKKVSSAWMWATVALTGALVVQFKWWDKRAPQVLDPAATPPPAALSGYRGRSMGCCSVCSGGAARSGVAGYNLSRGY